MVDAKESVSFHESRKALLVGLTAKAKGQETEKIIRFGNDDVPDFLRKLDSFEAKSRQACVVVK